MHADHAAWVDCAGQHVARLLRECVDATTGGLDATDFCNRLDVTNMCAVMFDVRPSLDEIRTVTKSIYECVSVRTRPLESNHKTRPVLSPDSLLHAPFRYMWRTPIRMMIGSTNGFRLSF